MILSYWLKIDIANLSRYPPVVQMLCLSGATNKKKP